MEYKPGTLVNTRGRDWVVLPSELENVLRMKPLGGREEDVIGIFRPLTASDDIRVSQFHPPSIQDLGSVRAGRLLYDAARLSLRSAAGPFRCAAKLGFRPRSYQMVPLIMALKQSDPIRLLIADDVGVGKTVEALLIAKELIERREIQSFAVLCPPHLCEQWQEEIKDKFQLDAVIIRTNTQAKLDRQIAGDTSVFQHYPYQVVSIDFIKSEHRYAVFAEQSPDLVIVDEAHTCAQPAGSHTNQQLRHRLLKRISQKQDRHLVLLTATPHSGKDAEFSSLIGMLHEDFAAKDWESDGRQSFRKDLARHFVQRRRGDISRWMDETTPFPKRVSLDLSYKLTSAYQAFHDEVLLFCTDLMQAGQRNQAQDRFRYWSALALLRGIMSSPAAGEKMLQNRVQSRQHASQVVEDDETVGTQDNPMFENIQTVDDELPTPVLDRTDWKQKERIAFTKFLELIGNLSGDADAKLMACIQQVKAWLFSEDAPYSPVIFCRYIQTAHYVAEHLQGALGKKVQVECVTSEDPDEVRKERVQAMGADGDEVHRRVLVATDCLSEGINLQDLFDAVLHYDLPWNPNRLEQREGRVDRFGQTRELVQSCLLYGQDNPIDEVVLRVLYQKAKSIRDSIGVSIPFPEDSKEFMDTIFQAVLADAEKKRRPQTQMELFSIDEIVRSEEQLETMLRVREKKEKALQSIFAQHSIKAQEIEADLQLTDAAVGRPETVCRFVQAAMDGIYGVHPQKSDRANLELDYSSAALRDIPQLQPFIADQHKQKTSRLSFLAPVTQGRRYLGRNHEAVETLCQITLSQSLHPEQKVPSCARAAVVSSKAVTERTVVYILRARNVIEDVRAKTHLVAEEVLLYGFAGTDRSELTVDVIDQLMENPQPVGEITPDMQGRQLQRELESLSTIQPRLDALAFERAEELILQHERYRRAMGEKTGSRFRVVEPVIPLDMLGIYIFLPGGRV